MRASVSGATIDGVLSARETVMAETPASLATSIKVVSPVPRRAARRGFLTRSGELGTVGDVTANLLEHNPRFAGVKRGELPHFFDISSLQLFVKTTNTLGLRGLTLASQHPYK